MEKKQINKKNVNKSKKKQKKKKMKIWKKILLIILLIILIAIGVFTYRVYKNGWGVSGMIATVIGHDENTRKNLPELRVLVLGMSTDLGDGSPTDTIMVASYNPNSQKATLLSIPRDTFIGSNRNAATPGEKINSLYSYGGAERILKAVNDLTGLGIDRYVLVRTEGLIKLVDAIGGVTFNVPIDMYYTDKSQDLVIDLKAGEQLLDGDKAEQLVRFRHNNDGSSYSYEYGNEDTGRMRTQREFIMQTLKQTLKPENIFKIGEILDIANTYVETNLDLAYVKDYIPYAVEFSTDNLLTETLPGENLQLPPTTKKWWFFEANKAKTQELVQELFYDRDLEQEETEDNINNSNNETESSATSNTTNSSNKVSKSDIELEVLNGSGNNSALQKAVEQLKNAGYKVKRTGTTNTTSKTTIINKKETKETLLKNIKETLGIGTIQSTENANTNSKVDVTVIIGKDY